MTAASLPVIGVASPPRYLDRSPERLRDFFGGRVETLQTILRIPDFAYDRVHFLAGWRACEEAFDDLAEAGAGFVVQVGSPFAYFHGLGHDGLAARCAALECRLGKPLVVAGLALVAALRHLGASRVAVAGMYYHADWCAALVRFLGEAGIEVTLAESFADQGLLAEGEAERAGWYFPVDRVMASLGRTAAAAPRSDVMVMAGVPTGIQDRVHGFEQETGLPLVSAEGATLWRLSALTGLAPPPGRHGRLLDGS